MGHRSLIEESGVFFLVVPGKKQASRLSSTHDDRVVNCILRGCVKSLEMAARCKRNVATSPRQRLG